VSGIPEQTFSLLIVVLVAMQALLAWTVLWSARSASVHAWCTAGLLGAAHLGLQRIAATEPSWPRLLEFPLLATLGVASFAFKWFALYTLSAPAHVMAARRWIARGLLLTLAVAIGMALAPVDRRVLSAFAAGGMLLALAATVVAADRLARHQRLVSARLLTVSLAIPWTFSLLLFVNMLRAGVDVLAVTPRPVFAGTMATGILFAVFNSGLFIGVVLELARRRQLAAEAALAEARAVRSRLEERARMVADLHDGFGSQLTSARLCAEQQQLSGPALCVILDECLADLHLVVDTVENRSGDIGDSLRFLRHRLTGRLRGAPVTPEWEVRTAGAPPLAPDRLLELLRILQEAISNALRHAHAHTVGVVAEYDADTEHLRCTVADDGQGFPAPAVEGAGLRNMRGRAARLGATLEVRSTPQGTTVTLAVPMGEGPPAPPLLVERRAGERRARP
jgi:signal transduction histidine kinase